MAAECADRGGHGIVAALLRVREVPADTAMAGAVEFTVAGTAIRASGCALLGRPFACDLSGQDFAKLIMAGWVPAEIVLGVSVAARHDDVLTTGLGNAEVPAYTDLTQTVRQDARSQLEHAVRRLGADGVVLSETDMRVHADARRARQGGTDHFATAVLTGTAIARFADRRQAALPPSLAVLSLGSSDRKSSGAVGPRVIWPGVIVRAGAR